MTSLNIQGRTLQLSNLDKVYWPQTGATKGKMLEFYIKAAPLLLPGLQQRLASLTRYPDGAETKGFYQKNCPEHAPAWVKTYPVHRSGGRTTNYIIVEDVPTLVWLANLGTIEFHPWLSSVDSLDNPDYAVFDLDPMEKFGIEEVRQVAVAVYQVLHQLGLASAIKTSGATGLQIFVPLEPVYSYTQARDFVHAVCTIVQKELPRWTTLERSVSRRQGKIYLDYMQNAREKTIVAAYSLRPRKLPTFSYPLEWSEVEQGPIEPENYTLERFLAGKVHPRPWLEGLVKQRLEHSVGSLRSML